MTNAESTASTLPGRCDRVRRGRALPAVIGAVALVALAGTVTGHGAQEQGLSDTEFWSIFSTMSEAGGTFASENFVSNETSFQEVIPSIQSSVTPGGVYLGVGPEQNFTYIANLKPRLAFIIDIRRQNAMHHLMYKALFELSETRAEFVSRLFSRPFTLRDPMAPPAVIFDSAEATRADPDAWHRNLAAIRDRLTKEHQFALSENDLASLEHVYQVFYEAGPAVNYGYRPGVATTLIRSRYPTFGDLQSATNADSVPMAFLATEENYRNIREMHLQNRIIPVVGDFAGPSAIRSVGDFLWERGLTVTAFYLSNVEQYLFRDRNAAERFYSSVATLPTDSTSTFIRSVPPNGGGAMFGFAPGTFGARQLPGSGIVGLRFSITIRDSGGLRVTQIVQDSNGVPIRRTMVDSGGRLVARDSTWIDSLSTGIRPGGFTVYRDSLTGSAPVRTLSRPMVINSGGSLLTSGTASIRETLERVLAGEIRSYQDVIGMTRTTGWRRP
jgi:hypothetical protein